MGDDLLTRANVIVAGWPRTRWLQIQDTIRDLAAEVERLRAENEAATADLAPESKTVRDMSNRQLRLALRRNRKKLRDAHLRCAELAAQRDEARKQVDSLRAAGDR